MRDLNRAAVRSTANKAIVWLCLARGSQPVGMSNRVHAANTFVYWFFFCLCAGFATATTAACGRDREELLGPRSDFSKPCQGAAEKSANATRWAAEIR